MEPTSNAEINKPRTVEDDEDLENARRHTEPPPEKKNWFQVLGPGLITGADDDPSGIGTYSQCGASFGYGLLWLVPLCLPLMIAVQEMCGRVGLVTGEGMAAIIRTYYPRWLLYCCVIMLFGANTLNVFADLNVMAASANMLFGFPFFFWLTAITVLIGALQVAVSYRVYSRILKFSCIALVGYVIVPFLRGSHNDWAAIGKNLIIPDLSLKFDYLLAGVAFLGTTISPYLFFWQAGETVEEEIGAGHADEPGQPRKQVRPREIRNIRADTATGMIASQVVAFFIVVATAGTIFASQKHTDINTAQDAAKALGPLGGGAGMWVFTICIVGTGFLAIPTLAGSAAYAAAEAFGWRYGLYRRFKRAPGFYLTILGVLLVGYLMNFFSTLSPVKALVYSAVVNAIVAVPLLIVLLLICNNRKIVGQQCNGKWSNLFGWLTVLFMGVSGAFFIWAVVTGKAS